MERVGVRRRIAWGLLRPLAHRSRVRGHSARRRCSQRRVRHRPRSVGFEHRYARYPWLAYAHTLPGVGYLLLAPIQLWRGFRNRHLRWHRRIGRVALALGLTSGVFAILFGFFLSFGGVLEATAAVAFGLWFIACLVLAYRSIRRRDVRNHRRWMIRAFAVGLAVGTIRIWIGLFEATGILVFRDAFGVAFWISFVMHTAAAELWLRWRPEASGFVMPARRAAGS